MDESDIKPSRFGRVSGDFDPESKVGTLNPKTFESGKFIRVNQFFLESGYFSVCDLLSLR